MKLERFASAPQGTEWLRSHLAGVASLVLGVAAPAVTAAVHLGAGRALLSVPDVRVTIPFLVLTVGALAVALGRREGTYLVPLLGVGLAAMAMVLGWALVIATAVALAAAAIAILSGIL